MQHKTIILLTLLLLFGNRGRAQEERQTLTLTNAIEMAQANSPSAQSARHTLRSAYWSWRSYKADYLPIVSLTSSPYLNRSTSSVTQNDGTELFIHRNYLKSDLALTVNQNIALTGGNLFVKSTLQRLDIFETKDQSYSASPLLIGYNQTLFGYNSLKWARRIQPAEYRTALKQYAETMELVASQAVGHFFSLATAQTNLQIAQSNLASADTLYRYAEGRYNIGTITESEMLQLEINKLNEETNMMDAQLEVDEARKSLCSYLGLPNTQELQVIIEDSLPDFQVPVDRAYSLALANSPDVENVKLSILSSESNLAYAKSNARLKADIYLQFGLSQTAQELRQSYTNPLDEQYVSVGLSLPILDWGRSKGKVRVAKSNLELTHTRADQTMFNFEQNVYKLVQQFNLQSRRAQVASKTDATARRRYEVALHLYLLGKSTTLDLNAAISAKDAARRSRISSLSTYWSLYYTLRSLTQYDFEKNCDIVSDHEKVIKN